MSLNLKHFETFFLDMQPRLIFSVAMFLVILTKNQEQLGCHGNRSSVGKVTSIKGPQGGSTEQT